jgi:EAL domain-containing protein (putative c-di-GMP-specific phosphodiesterase class I)
VRWHSPELGLLPPGRFVKLFETNGFVVDLDYYMLEQVLRIQQLRYDQGKRFVPISVNQSGLHISEEGYLDRMREMLAKFDLPRGAVDLEITETAFVDYTTQGSRTNATDIVRELQQMGYLISMDDFCTGYSSIAMLRNLPMDIMKIDRSMLLAAEEDPRAEKILRYVINMGDALGMQVLCEGIETLSQEQLLLDNGCFYGQGYLFGKPMQLDDFLAKLDAEDAAAARQQPQLAH